MLVTNTTSHCFVLSSGVIIRPNVVDVAVADATYATDSTLNQQIDALQAGGEITITSKPTDTFPPPVQSDVDGQVVLTASAADKLPLKLVAHNGQTAAVLEVVDGDGTKLFQILPDGVQLYADDNGGNYNTFYTGVGGSGVNQADAASPAFQIWAQGGASANLFEAYDENGNLVAKLIYSGQELVLLDAAQNQTANVGSGGVASYGVVGSDGQFYVNARPSQSAPLIWADDENGNPIFQVRVDGTVHIKTGGTIHADL